jgi:hypothetical protein
LKALAIIVHSIIKYQHAFIWRVGILHGIKRRGCRKCWDKGNSRSYRSPANGGKALPAFYDFEETNDTGCYYHNKE